MATKGFLFVILNCILLKSVIGSCFMKKENRILCCKNKNYSCSGFDRTGMKMSGRQIKCFCDEHCLKTNDCCSDYRNLCGKIDLKCVLSNWAAWSPCSTDCGTGVQKRQRKVLIPSQSMGKKCKHTRQARVCRDQSCPTSRKVSMVQNKRHHKSNQGSQRHENVAHLIPELEKYLNSYKLFQKHTDIRNSIYDEEFWFNNISQPINHLYCATYEVTYSSADCKKWNELSDHEQVYWKVHSQYLNNGQLVCLTCLNPLNIGFSCYGGGNLNEFRKWRAVRSDDCYGYFKMMDKPKMCQCHPGPLSYHII